MKAHSFLIFLAVILLSGCDPHREESFSAATEDGRYTAKLFLEFYGATNPQTFGVYLSNAGAKPDFAHASFSGTAWVSSVAWREHILTIPYANGEIGEFSSRWTSPDGDKVELRLEAHCEASCIGHKRWPSLKAPAADQREQVLSAASSDGKFTALLTRESSSVEQETLYRLRVVSAEQTEQQKWATMILEAKGLQTPILTWDSARPVLQLSYAGGEITKFQNIWRDDDKYYRNNYGADGEELVEIRLAAKCDGMCF